LAPRTGKLARDGVLCRSDASPHGRYFFDEVITPAVRLAYGPRRNPNHLSTSCGTTSTFHRKSRPSKTNTNASATSPKHPTAASEASKSAAQPDYSYDKQNSITLLPPIDWAHEAELAVHDSMARTEREKLYRNLAGLSAAQLHWIQKNHMEPVDTNPPWSETRPRNKADGILWISDHCALVNLVPYCFIKFGHKEARGDLFQNMRQYLGQRLTDPLP
jgi:hypothetical protein